MNVQMRLKLKYFFLATAYALVNILLLNLSVFMDIFNEGTLHLDFGPLPPPLKKNGSLYVGSDSQ